MKNTFLFFVAILLALCHLRAQEVSKIDSLKSALMDADVSEKSTINIELARSYFKENSDLHLFYARESYDYAMQENDHTSAGKALSEVGRYYYRQGNYDSAYFYIKKSLPLYSSRNNKAAAYSQISSIERNRGNYAQSIKLLFKSDSLYRLENDTLGLIVSNVNLGTILGKKGDYKESITYFKKAGKLAEKDKPTLGKIFNNLSVSYMKLEDIENAKKYGLKSIAIREQLRDSFDMAHSYVNYASLLVREEKNQEGILYFKKALSIFQKFRGEKDMMNCYNGLGDIYRKLGDFSKSKQYLLEARKLGEKVKNHTTNLSNFEKLHLLSRDTQEWEEAYNYLVSHTKLNDSIINLEKIKIAKELQTKYETDKIIKEKELAEINMVLAQTRAESNLNFGIAMSFLGGLFLLGGLFAYNRLKTKKQQEILSLKLEESENKLHLEQQARKSELKALQSQMNPHFVYNALNSIQDLILLKDVRNSNKYLGKFSNFIRNVLNFSTKGFVSISEEIGVLKLYTELEQLRFGDQLKVSIDNQLNECDSDHFRIPSMFIQPYLENSLKHGLLHKEGEKELSVQFKKKDSYIICSIEDNGVGRKKAIEIRERRKSKHNGFSTGANQERIALLNKGKSQKIKIEVIDKERNNNPQGTKTTLFFPVLN